MASRRRGPSADAGGNAADKHAKVYAGMELTLKSYTKRAPSSPIAAPFPDAAPTVCHFFRLPPELRDSIYAYAFTLVKTRQIITKTSFRQPHLLRVCRQIRHEGSLIYYHIKHFSVNLGGDLDMGLVLRFFQHSNKIWWSNKCDDEGFKTSTPVLQVVEPRNTDWDALLRWLRAFHEDGAPRPVCGEECAANACCAVTGAFDIVSQFSGMAWKDLVPLLGIHKEATRRAKQISWR